MSHHGQAPDKVEEFTRLNRFHVDQVAYFIDKMKTTRMATAICWIIHCVIYGSPMGDGSIHNHLRIPLFLAGKSNGKLTGNNHLLCKDGTPFANVLLTLLQKLGVETDSFGDSNGTVEL